MLLHSSLYIPYNIPDFQIFLKLPQKYDSHRALQDLQHFQKDNLRLYLINHPCRFKKTNYLLDPQIPVMIQRKIMSDKEILRLRYQT